MNVLLIYPDIILENKGWPGYYYNGIGSICAVLKKNGHKVELLHILHFNLDEIMSSILQNSYEVPVIGFSVTTNQFPYAKAIADKIKQSNLRAFIVFGGIHTTLNPDEVISEQSIDAICMGEGEYPFLELCNNIVNGKDIKSINNLWIKENGKIHRNQMRRLLNLNELPFPDRDIFRYKTLLHERMGEASVMVSRGCPYRCSYCCNHALKEIYDKLGQYVRFQSVEYAMNQLKDILEQYGFIRAFAFDDDILPLKKDWFEEFALSYKKEINLPFTCNVRPDLVDKKMVELLKSTGCWRMHIGIESGNNKIRNNILLRGISDQVILNAIDLAEKQGIKIYTYNMIGIPGESGRNILDTVKMNTSGSIEISQVTFFYPYKHTQLGAQCEKKGLLANTKITDYFAESPLKFSFFHKRKLLLYMKHFSNLVRIYRKIKKLPLFLSPVLIQILDLIAANIIGLYMIDKTYNSGLFRRARHAFKRSFRL